MNTMKCIVTTKIPYKRSEISRHTAYIEIYYLLPLGRIKHSKASPLYTARLCHQLIKNYKIPNRAFAAKLIRILKFLRGV